MIHDATTLDLPARIRADLCVVGTGPGGTMAALEAARAGLKVIMLEAGALVTPASMSQREEHMVPRLLWDSGARTAKERTLHIHQGHGVGGSALHNLNLCKRAPAALRRAWIRDRGLTALPMDTWDRLYGEIEKLLWVQRVPERRWNRANRLLRAGCEALGWRWSGLSHNRTGCRGAGFCEIGCSYDAKNNALKVVVPTLVDRRHAVTILTRAQAVRVLHTGGEVFGVEAAAVDAPAGRVLGRVTIESTRVCLAASATGTPAILQRSDVPDPSETTGRGLRIHPAVIVAGDYAQEVRAWKGIPQTCECTAWLDVEAEGAHSRRTWIVPAFGHPMAAATMLPGHGSVHRDVMTRYAHLSVLTAMLHDETAGTVSPRGDLGVAVDYWPDPADRQELARGLERCARLHLAAGARRVLVPTDPPIELGPGDDPSSLARLDLTPDTLDLTAVHPMASVPMGDDPAKAAVDSRGRHHHLSGLWVSDGSLLPSSIGVPPQLSIYALGLHVGRGIVSS